MSNRFRRLTDLFVVGKSLPMSDGTYLWVQALNSYQRDEAISDAQIARARLVMALREKGDEKTKVEAKFYEQGRDQLIDDLASHRGQAKVSDYLDEMRDDPEWKERMDLIMRADPDDGAKPLTSEELNLLSDINTAVLAEMQRREQEEREFVASKLHRLSDEELIAEWTEEWLERRGTELAGAEFRLTELWYATRYCNGIQDPDSERIDHSACESHSERVFAERADVRGAPNELMAVIQVALAELNVSGRDPKDWPKAENSSGSLPTPNEPAASTPSTSAATPAPPPGTSPQPLLTH